VDRRRIGVVVAVGALVAGLGACRGGGDDTAARPDAEEAPTSVEPDRSDVADAAGTTGAGADTEPAGEFVVAQAAVGRLDVFDAADATAPARSLANPNAEGGPLVLLVLGPATGGRLPVELPVRPNGSTGWVQAIDVDLSRHAFHLEVRLSERVLIAYDGARVVLQEPIGVGQEPTPTPGGRYYLYELLRPPDPDGAYGPYAFGLSGFSESLTSFAGCDGRLGIHGTNDPSSLGADSTHGCIRLANPAIVQLADTVPLGTPVVILP
jgi:hypothetical protein